MQTGQHASPLSAAEMAEAIKARVLEGARRYRRAVLRYLLRTPLGLRAKYVAFLLDLHHQSDVIQEVLGRAAERVAEPRLAELLRFYLKEERSRTQLVVSDLRRLGYDKDKWPGRPRSTGDTALRAYGTTLSFEQPRAVLGLLLVFLGVSGEISPTIVRLLTVGMVPREAMRWLLLREGSDPQCFTELRELVAQEIRDTAAQTAILDAVEVSGELLALGAASRPSL